jgi:hypothetical protein
MRTILYATVLSVLVFLSFSFLSVLSCIKPLHNDRPGELSGMQIGVPFTYYQQFYMKGQDMPNYGWSVPYLIYDYFLTMILVAGLYWLKHRKKTRNS